MPSIQLQISDITSCIGTSKTDDFYKMIEKYQDETLDPEKNLYCDRNQRWLSYQNDQNILIFGRTEDDRSIMLNVEGFRPFFYLGFDRDITRQEMTEFVTQLKFKADRKYRDHLYEPELLYKQPYEKFVGSRLFPFIKLSFKNKYSFKHFEQIALNERTLKSNIRGQIPFYVGESNLDEILKAIHGLDIKPSSWIEVTYTKEVSLGKKSYCQVEINCNISNIKRIDKITNCPFKYMLYDLECGAHLGELGNFPVAKKNYQQLAREFLDLWSTHQKHDLLKNELTMYKVVDTCLKLVFTPYFYTFNLNRISTINNLKPEQTLIESTVHTIYNLYLTCDKKVNECLECIDQISNLLDSSFPPAVNSLAYYELSRYIWINLNNLTRSKYNINSSWNELEGYLKMMLRLAFENYYDCFNFSPIELKTKQLPSNEQLGTLTPDICKKIRDTTKTYEERLEDLTKFFDNQLSPLFPKGDPIIQIGFTVQRLGDIHPHIKGIYTLKKCQPFTNDEIVYDENDTDFKPEELTNQLATYNKKGANLHTKEDLVRYLANEQLKTDKSKIIIKSFETEADMIREFGKFINKLDPDLIGGYNTFGFDDRYLYTRVEELFIREDFLANISRLKHDMAAIQQPAGANNKEEIKGKRKMETHYLNMIGRIPFDIYRIIPNSYNLPEYKLNSVCKHFLNKEKNDVPPTQIPVLQRGSPTDRSLVARYCVIDCVLCNRLLDKLSILNNLIAMSNVSLVPIKYLLFRGQTIKGFSLIVKKCSQRGKIVKTLRKEEKSLNVDKYEGAIVLDPLIDIYTTPISVADFNSLYPSSMISENISNDTLVSDSEYDNLPGFFYNTIKYDEYIFQPAKNKRTGQLLKKMEKIKQPEMRVCRFVGNVKGILPEIEEELIDNRKKAKDQMEFYKKKGDHAMAAAWDCQQLAYKITCNSIYGITGASVSPIYNKEVAASITSCGRRMITFSKAYVENNYVNLPITLKMANISTRDIIVKKATCVYGDTDSVFIKFDMVKQSDGTPLTDTDAVFASMEVCTIVAKEISFQLKSPQNLDFEKTIYPFLIVNKKMYKGNYYMDMNVNKFKPKVMGMTFIKRDSALVSKTVAERLIDLLFSIRPESLDQATIRNFITTEFRKILNGEYPLEYFIRTKSWKGHYANPLAIAQHVLAVRQAIRDPGNQFQINDRIPFVHIVNPKATLMGDRIETIEYFKRYNLQIDYNYYIENMLIASLSKILRPIERLGVNESWLLNILKTLCIEKKHVATIDSFLKIIPAKPKIIEAKKDLSNSSDFDDSYSDDL